MPEAHDLGHRRDVASDLGQRRDVAVPRDEPVVRRLVVAHRAISAELRVHRIRVGDERRILGREAVPGLGWSGDHPGGVPNERNGSGS